MNKENEVYDWVEAEVIIKVQVCAVEVRDEDVSPDGLRQTLAAAFKRGMKIAGSGYYATAGSTTINSIKAINVTDWDKGAGGE